MQRTVWLACLLFTVGCSGASDDAGGGPGNAAGAGNAGGSEGEAGAGGNGTAGAKGTGGSVIASGGSPTPDAGAGTLGGRDEGGSAGNSTVGSDASSESSANKPALCGEGGAALFCEGFENAKLDPAWNPVSCNPATYPGGNPNATGSHQRDTARASSGSASWHAHVDFGPDPPAGGSCQAELRRAVTFPAPDAFLRMFVYVPAGKVPFEFNMLTDSHGFFAVGLDYPMGPLHAGGYDSQGSPVNGKSSTPFPTDRWVCVEWQLHQGSDASITAWQEGVTVIDRAPVTVPAGTHLDRLFFGIYVGNAENSTVDVWLDDLALSATRIGCTGH